MVNGNDLSQRHSIDFAVPLLIPLDYGVAQIWVSGEIVHRKDGKTMSLMGHSMTEVMTDSAADAQYREYSRRKH